MVDLTQIDLLLAVGVAVAFFAIGAGVRGVYSVSATARRERSGQDTTILPAQPPRRKNPTQPPEKRRAA